MEPSMKGATDWHSPPPPSFPSAQITVEWRLMTDKLANAFHILRNSLNSKIGNSVILYAELRIDTRPLVEKSYIRVKTETDWQKGQSWIQLWRLWQLGTMHWSGGECVSEGVTSTIENTIWLNDLDKVPKNKETKNTPLCLITCCPPI